MTPGRPKKEAVTSVEIILDDDKKAKIRKAFFEALAFSKRADLDDWADLHRRLPQEVAAEYGQWQTSRFPFLRRIMKCLSPSSKARSVVVMKGAQLGFTETAINWMLYTSVENPGPMLYAQKTDDAAKDFSVQKLKTSIEICEATRYTLGANKPRNYANSWSNKAYPGGFIVLGGANSTSFLRGTSARDVILDEEDSYDLNIGREGSPAALAGMRQINFPDRKMFRLSTPVLKEMSTIEPAYEAGSQEQRYVPCPHCNPKGLVSGFNFVLEWEQVHWSDKIDRRTGYPEKCWLTCPRCFGEIFEDKHKTWMLDRGDWYSTKGSDERYKVGDVENPSFQISSLYSPLGFFSWMDAVKMWFNYKRTNDVALLQVFINQVLGQTFSLEGSEISYGHLHARRETYADNNGEVFDVPMGGLVLTAGADIQDDRIEIEVVAWGEQDESWSVDYAVLVGNTALVGDARGILPDGQPSVWKLLDDYLLRRWHHESGVYLPVEIAMIDSGYKTTEVHTFCRLREGRRIFPIKGVAGWGKGFWAVARRRHDVYKTFLYKAHTDELKNKLYASLQIEEPGPGYCHHPTRPAYSPKFFKGLTCETREVKMIGGRKKLFWNTPQGARNEPIDCRNYAYVARLAYPVDLAQRTDGGIQALFASAAAHAGQVARRRRGPRRRGSAGL
jgi:phage terminase large subunit GpA-like protein